MKSLTDFIKQHNITITEFARQNGLAQPTIWRIAKGKVTPSPRIAKAIEKATRGEVSAVHLVGLD
uniref:Putative antitoxin n=1 Tax=viral metagenome TaxID=1070528 RepID=A0A6H1Z9Y2_9ZZZZ